MTTPSHLLALARQGNTQAIALLLNRTLQPQGITAKVLLKQGCLQVMLEAEVIPPQQALVAFVQQGVTKLKAPVIQRLMLYGKTIGEEFPAWMQAIELTASPPTVMTPPMSTTTVKQATHQAPLRQQPPKESASGNRSAQAKKLDLSAALGIAGALTLFLGAFSPLLSLPSQGTLNYFAAGKDAGVTLLLLVVITLILVLKQQYRWLWATGLSAFMLATLAIVSFQMRVAEVASLVEKAANEWTRVPDSVIANLQIKWQWGLLLLLLGAGLLLAAAFTQQKRPDRDIWCVTALTPTSVVISALFYVPVYVSALGCSLILLALMLRATRVQALLAALKTEFPVTPAKQVAIGRLAMAMLGCLLILMPAAYIKLAVNDVKARHWQTEALRMLDRVNSEQKTFYLVNGSFALNLKQLGLELPVTTEPYQYEVLTQNQSLTQVTARAQQKDLKSYTGGVFGSKNQALALLCATKHPSQTPPKLFQPGQNPMECPSEAIRVAAPD